MLASKVKTEGIGPGPRQQHSMCYFETEKAEYLIIFAGRNDF